MLNSLKNEMQLFLIGNYLIYNLWVLHVLLGFRAAYSVLPDCTSLAVDNVRRLAVNLYSELLSRLVTNINRSLKPRSRQPCNIFLFDSPGFQNPSTSGENILQILLNDNF